MNNILYLPLIIDGTEVLVQAEQHPQIQEAGSATTMINRVENAFETAKTAITKVAASMVSSIRNMQHDLRPQEVTIKLGIKFDVAGNVIIANTGVGASLDVEIKYTL